MKGWGWVIGAASAVAVVGVVVLIVLVGEAEDRSLKNSINNACPDHQAVNVTQHNPAFGDGYWKVYCHDGTVRIVK